MGDIIKARTLPDKFNRVATVLGVLVVVFGISVLVGYAFEIDELKIVFPGKISMNPFTAIGFILAGTSVVLLQLGKHRTYLRWAGFGCALIVAVLGVAKLVGAISGHSAVFDHLLFTSQVLDVPAGLNNLMRPATAVGLVLVSVAILLNSQKKYPRLSLGLVTIGYTIGLLTLLSFAFGAKDLAGIPELQLTAYLNTSIGFMVLSLSIMLTLANTGYMKLVTSETHGGVLLRRLLPILIVLPTLLGYAINISESKGLISRDIGIASVGIISIFSVILITMWMARKADIIDKAKLTALNKFQRSVAKEKSILASVGEGIIILDRDLKLSSINPFAEDLVGWRQHELVGKYTFRDVLKLADSNDKKLLLTDAKFSALLEEHKEVSFDSTSKETYYLTRKDGTEFPVAIVADQILLSGENIGIVVALRDISAEKELERSKSEFISLASHQLKTPPTAMSWNTELLLKTGKLSKEQRKLVLTIQDVSKHMKEVVDSLLNVSRLELGTFEASTRPVDLRELAKEVIAEQTPSIKAKHIILKTNFTDTLPTIPADPGLSKIILDNLITNAVKYTPAKGKVTVTIKKDEGRSTTLPSILISVADTGIGIPKQQQDQIFTKMFRADNAQKVEEGTGIGLYLLKYIVEFAGGKVWFESALKKGTTFYVSLPLKGMPVKAGTSRLT